MSKPDGPSDGEVLYVLSRCTVLSGISRLIPIPFLDDLVAERVRKHLVASLLELHDRPERASRFSTLYREASGSCLGSVFGFFRALIFKPIKKLFRTIFFFLAIRDASLQMTRVFLLGHSIDLCLKKDLLFSEEDARQLGEAFTEAFRGTDRRFLVHVMRQAGRGFSPVRVTAERALRRVFGQRDGLAQTEQNRLAQLTPQESARLDEETRRLAVTLDQEEVASFLEGFDRRFLKRLEEIRSGSGNAASR